MTALTFPCSETAPAPRPSAPPGTLLRGHFDAFFADKTGFLTQCAREHGDIVPLRFGPKRAWLVSDPAIIAEVFTTHAASFHKSVGLRRARAVVGDGLFTSEGKTHERRSRIAQPAFRPTEVARYAGAIAELAEEAVASWADGARVDLAAELSNLALAVVARTLFGTDLRAEAPHLGAALTELLHLLDGRLARTIPLPLWVPTPENRRFRAARAVLDDAVYAIIRARRATLAAGAPDLLSRLMVAGPGGEGGLTDLELRDEVMTIFLAGHKTTASALAFTFRLLAERPDVLARLRAEAAAVLEGRSACAAHQPELVFTGQVFAEALRLYPPAWMVNRQAIEDVTLGGGRLCVRRGAMVATSPFVVQRDARFFEEPEAFRPERFAREAPRPAPYAYFPFGGGKRACIGRSFALLEAAMIMPTIVRAVDFEIDTSRPIGLLPQITLRPAGGVPAIVRRRRAG